MELPLETCEPGKTSGYHRGTSLSDGQPIEAETTGTKTVAWTYGLPGLTDREKNLADSDAALLLKQVGLFIRSEECRERHRVRTAFLLESPQDPLTYVPQAREEESPSFWAWPELMQLLRYQNGFGIL